MRWKTTVALLMAMVGLGAYISLYEIKQPSRQEREQLAKRVVSVETDAATQLVLDLPNAKATLTRNGSAWTLSPRQVRADPTLVNRILGYLDPLTAERVLSATPARPLDLKAFGLDPAVGWIAVASSGPPVTILIGDPTPVGGNRYLKIADRPEVYVVASALFDVANQPTDAFRDPLLLRFNASEVSSIAVASPSSTFTVTRTDTAWRLTQPFADAADRGEINALLNRLNSLRVQRFVDDAPAPDARTKASLDTSPLHITVTQDKPSPSTTTVTFGGALEGAHGMVMVMRSDEPSLYAVAETDLSAILRNPQGLRSRTCFEFFMSGVVKVELSREGSGWTIERRDGTWRDQATGSTLDAERVDDLLSELADLRLSGFVEEVPSDLVRYGLEPPAGVMTVWTSTRENPQRLLLGAPLEQSTSRYGRIEGRNAVVRLPEEAAALLATTLDQLRALSPVNTAPGPTAPPASPPTRSPSSTSK